MIDAEQSFGEGTTLKVVSGLVRALHADLISIEEFSSTVLSAIVVAKESAWDRCLDAIPDEAFVHFRAYCEEYLIPVDFMPSPKMFMVNRDDEAEAKRIQEELRPKYVRLLESMKSRPVRSESNIRRGEGTEG